MRAVRRGAIIGSTIVGALAAVLVAVDCASPTEIVIDVTADKDLCEDADNPLNVGFGVTKMADVSDTKTALSDFQTGCKIKSQGIVGTMVIQPNGDKNATIGVRVVASVGGNATDCANDQSNCIISQRLVTFQSGQTVRETVNLSGACKGEVCGENQDCVAGKCVDRTAINDDGGVEPDAGHPTDPDVFVPPPDTGSPDSGPPDVCTRCTGGTTHSCDKGNCTINCTDPADCARTTLCAPGLNCTIVCATGNACNQTHCQDGNCKFDCSGQQGDNHCRNISCDAGTCNAICSDAGSEACNGVLFTGNQDSLTCAESANGDVGCDNVTCNAPKSGLCKRTCGSNDPAKADAGGCGDASTCSDNGQACSPNDYQTRPNDPPDVDAATGTMH